jgi:iron complex transport system ATP-binding protein
MADPALILLQAEQIGVIVDGSTLIDQVSLRLYAGEVVGVIGPNGAGKSSLLRALCGLLPTNSGRITLDNCPLSSYRPRDIARRLALLPQSATFDAAFTVREVALMGRNPHLGRFEVETAYDRQIVADALVATDMVAFADRLITTLSGGERQRVFMARALAQNPLVLLLDEPISNLDVRHQLDLLTLTRRLASERSLGVLVAIHDLSLAARFCDRLLLLDNGRLVAEGTPDVVLTPENLARAFHIAAQVYRDPFTGALTLSISALPVPV